MKKLTPQQTKVLNCIRDSINKTGFPPTRAEICSELGFSSPNSAETPVSYTHLTLPTIRMV